MLTEEYLVSIFVLIIVISIFYYKYIRTTSTFPNIEERTLPHHTEKSFWIALRLSAREHGYGGLFPSFRFLIRRFVNHNLQLVARVIPYSGLRIILHRMRGVKISGQVHIGPLVTIDDVYPDYVVIKEGASIAGSNYILAHTKPLSYHKNLMESHVAPVTIKENEFQRLIGPTKYRAHLNFVYGVLVEQGLQLTVMEEIIKENISFMKKRSHILNNEVHHRIYGITKSELLKSFQESGLEVNDSREFTYSLFKYRLNNSEPARIASDTRKGLSALHKYRSIARYTPWSEKGVTGYR